MALTYSKPEMIGKPAPAFSLLGTDGKQHSLQELGREKQATVIMFICNHCPYVIANFDRLVALAKEFSSRGVQFIGINANDATHYPDDSFDNMVKVARSREFPFPYLHDADQSVACAYDAVCTPEIYVADADGVIRYHGGIDDSWKDASAVKKHFLRNAIEDILARRSVAEPTPHAMGCSIKWSA